MIRTRKTTWRPGAAMSEMVLVMPLLLVILSLVFFFGRLMVRAQHVQVTSRYETWRHVISAPGPGNGEGSTAQLNEAFFAGNASTFTQTQNNNNFPDDTYVDIVDAATAVSEDAGLLANALLFLPDSEDPRQSHGRREGFRVGYTTQVPLWQEMDGPIRRQHARIGHEWHFSHSWTAGPDEWQGSAVSPHHLRANRDVFLTDFDAYLDGIDGETDPEYGQDAGTQRSTSEALAGFIRTMYLHEPGYRGPIVYDELDN
jgi:hypothetical protein